MIATAESPRETRDRLDLTSVEDLIESDLTFGIAVQQAAAGRAVRRVVGANTDRLGSRAKMQGENVMALGQALALGQLDVAIIWDTVVHQINRNHDNGNSIGQRLVILRSLGSGARSSVSLAVIKVPDRDAQSETAIEAFLQYLDDSEAWKSRLTGRGFLVEKQGNGPSEITSSETTSGEQR